MPFFSRGSVANRADNPNSYTLVGGTAPSCTGTEFICSIQAPNDGNNKPIISQALVCEMIQALENGTNTANIGLRS